VIENSHKPKWPQITQNGHSESPKRPHTKTATSKVRWKCT